MTQVGIFVSFCILSYGFVSSGRYFWKIFIANCAYWCCSSSDRLGIASSLLKAREQRPNRRAAALAVA